MRHGTARPSTRSIFDNDALFDDGAVSLARRNDWQGRIGAFLQASPDHAFAELDNSGFVPRTGEWFHVVPARGAIWDRPFDDAEIARLAGGARPG